MPPLRFPMSTTAEWMNEVDAFQDVSADMQLVAIGNLRWCRHSVNTAHRKLYTGHHEQEVETQYLDERSAYTDRRRSSA